MHSTSGKQQEDWHANRNAPATCLIPDCDSRAILSHIVSKSRLKAMGSHVWQLRTMSGGQNFYRLERRGIGKAMTFYGYCATHDQRLFEPIERGPMPPRFDRMHARLLSLRSVGHEIRKKENNIRWFGKGYGSPHYERVGLSLTPSEIEAFGISALKNTQTWLLGEAKELIWLERVVPRLPVAMSSAILLSALVAVRVGGAPASADTADGRLARGATGPSLHPILMSITPDGSCSRMLVAVHIDTWRAVGSDLMGWIQRPASFIALAVANTLVVHSEDWVTTEALAKEIGQLEPNLSGVKEAVNARINSRLGEYKELVSPSNSIFVGLSMFTPPDQAGAHKLAGLIQKHWDLSSRLSGGHEGPPPESAYFCGAPWLGASRAGQ